MPGARLTFPLVPRRRVIGLSFGTMRSLRRGSGTDVAGSRPYRPGDDMDAIDWAASARLSTREGSDEFVVRERFAEEAPRVVIVCDRRPEMAFFAPPLPWLDKPQAMRHASSSSSSRARRRRRLRRLPRLRGRRAALAPAEGRAEADRAARRAALVVRVRRPAGLARALDRPPRRAPARRHAGHVRLRALRLPPGAVRRDVARRRSSTAGTSSRS